MLWIYLSFTKYDFQKGGEQIKGYSISEINKIIKYWYIKMGLSEPSLNSITKPLLLNTLQGIM